MFPFQPFQKLFCRYSGTRYSWGRQISDSRSVFKLAIFLFDAEPAASVSGQLQPSNLLRIWAGHKPRGCFVPRQAGWPFSHQRCCSRLADCWSRLIVVQPTSWSGCESAVSTATQLVHMCMLLSLHDVVASGCWWEMRVRQSICVWMFLRCALLCCEHPLCCVKHCDLPCLWILLPCHTFCHLLPSLSVIGKEPTVVGQQLQSIAIDHADYISLAASWDSWYSWYIKKNQA